MRQREQAQTPRTKMMQIRRQIFDINEQIASMRADFNRIGEASNWNDPSLEAREADIAFWEDRVKRLRWQLRVIDRLISVETPTPAA